MSRTSWRTPGQNYDAHAESQRQILDARTFPVVLLVRVGRSVLSVKLIPLSVDTSAAVTFISLIS